MVRSATESGTLCETNGEWRLLEPETAVTGHGVDSLRGIIQARLDQLSAEERRVLQVAAVLGENWTGSLLARLLEDNLPEQAYGSNPLMVIVTAAPFPVPSRKWLKFRVV